MKIYILLLLLTAISGTHSESDVLNDLVKALQTKPTTKPTAKPTTEPPKCATACSMDKVTLTPGDPEKSTSTPTATQSVDPSTGCAILTVVCGEEGQTGQVFMQFNQTEGGPVQPTGGKITAVLTCDAEKESGMWTYNSERVIKEVNCISAKPAA
ncbi:c6 domain-containing protein [Ditylenchus destructor]|nr:c6 domain-containing protein [Ditylenchus destructor]